MSSNPLSGASGMSTLRFLSDLKARPWAHDFFAAARRLEASHDRPGFGDTLSPSDDPVRFGQTARMEFSPRAIDGLEQGDAAPRLRLLFTGLFGPNGPMPYHLTEFITDRRQHHNDETLEAFADIFHHRFFSVFYRAWADTDPAVALDRSDRACEDVFEKFMGAVGGTFGLGAREFSDTNRRYYMSQIGPSSSRPESLERILGDRLGAGVAVHEFQGTWLDIDISDRMALGTSAIGDGSVLGSQVWSRNSAFEIEIGPLDAENYEALLPGGKEAALVHDVVTAVVGLELEWSVRLVRAGDSVDGATLGGGEETGLGGGQRLGWTGWMGDIDDDDVLDDLVIQDIRYAPPHLGGTIINSELHEARHG